MTDMRTTIDIPPLLHERIMAYAQMQGRSFSATAVEALLRGMAPIETPDNLSRSPLTGLMVVNTGHPVTSEDVAELIDEDD